MKTFLAACILLVAAPLLTSAKPLSEEVLKGLCRDANFAMQTAADATAKQAAFDEVTAKWSKRNDISQISTPQVSMLFEYGGLSLDAYLRRWIEPTLTSKANEDAAFAFLAWKFMPENDGFMHSPKETDMFIRFLMDKKLQNVINDIPTCAADILAALATMKDANWQTEGFPLAVLTFVKCTLPESQVMECVKAFNSAARAEGITDDQREAIRLECVKQYERLKSSTDIARKQKVCSENIAYLNGPFACGQLVGNAAPDLHFHRVMRQAGDSVATLPVQTLADFKGKVVLIDFWGTKCVPCVKSFPEVAELQNHYEGKDVVILGVTSLQGYFVDTPNHRTVQCRNQPEKELGCFPGYMKGMGINWTIGVSEEDVMNTDYGVLAIPHITIIDRQGRVRYNAINTDNEGKIALIDQLLNE